MASHRDARSEHNQNWCGNHPARLGDPDVAIEFTEPSGGPKHMACIHEGVPVVVGTTGWYDSLAE